MRFGVYLPSFAWADLGFEQIRRLREFARRAEALGFESLWVAEHLLTAPGLYGVPWLSPIPVLAHVAAVTERIKLGTGILILPLRHPVQLARDLETLIYLSEDRFLLGIGAGWDAHEFEVCGVPLRERGGRTDEVLAILRRLFTERDVSHQGKYYQFDRVTIEPLPPRMPDVWVAGGSKVVTELSPDKPFIVPSVLKRIAGADVWMARAAGTQQMVKDDWQQITDYCRQIGRDPATLTFAHINFTHLVEGDDREKVLATQRPLIERMMGTHRSFEHLQQCYLLGTTAEIVERIRDLERAGLQYLLLGTVDYDVEQLDRWAADILPHFQAPTRATA